MCVNTSEWIKGVSSLTWASVRKGIVGVPALGMRQVGHSVVASQENALLVALPFTIQKAAMDLGPGQTKCPSQDAFTALLEGGVLEADRRGHCLVEGWAPFTLALRPSGFGR